MAGETAFKISPYVAFIASGSEISTSVESGYEPGLTRELQRVGLKGGTLRLNADELLDLAEFCDALAIAESQAGNPSGARSLTLHAQRAREAAGA